MRQLLLGFTMLLLAVSGYAQDQKPPPYGIKYETKTIHKTLDGCDSTTSACPDFNLTYVWMTEGKNKDIFNRHTEEILFNDIYKLENAKYTSIEDMGSAFVSDYASYRKDFPEAPDIGWYLDASYENMNELSQVVSFDLSYNMYTGGAHPIYYSYYYNYDYNTGEPVTLKQILVPGFEKELNRLIEVAFRKEYDLSPNQSLTDAGTFEENIEFNDNFLLTPAGIWFHYNIYEIRAYVYGATDLLIPYSDLIDLIDENGLGIY